MINKVLWSLLLLLSITLNAQELIEGNNKLEASNLKHFEAEYNANGAIDNETGFMRINNSETFQSKYQEAKDIADDVNINMQNVTISSGTVKVKACNDVNLENVTIKSGATLEIKAGGAFRVNYANFTIEAGAQFVVI